MIRFMRTVEQFIDEMLARKRHWTAILSVSRVARGGAWSGKAKQILRDRKLIPESDEELNKMRDQILAEDRKRNDEEKLKHMSARHEGR